MSFVFATWPEFSDNFYRDAKDMLSNALNKGTKPAALQDRIEVQELNMGTQPPELDILEIGDLALDKFRGIFRLTYSGDAYIVLQTKVQINPLSQHKPTLDLLPAPAILFASAPLKVPMHLRLSELKLRAIIVLVVSKQKGITLVFKNDPLESVRVSSTFDSVGVIQGFIQKEIENQLRELFRSDLPGIIHRLSQRWLAEGMSTKKAEQPYFNPHTQIETQTDYKPHPDEDKSRYRQSMPDLSKLDLHRSTRTLPTRPRSAIPQSPSYQSVDLSEMSVPESIAAYDPTYGLRPEGIPPHAAFSDLRRLSRTNQERGLGDIIDRPNDEDDGLLSTCNGPDDSYDHIGLRDLVADSPGDYQSLQPWDSISSVSQPVSLFPAIGGGFISRPRILHQQSQMRVRHSSGSSAVSGHASPSGSTVRHLDTPGHSPFRHSTPIEPLPQEYFASPPRSMSRNPSYSVSLGGSAYQKPGFIHRSSASLAGLSKINTSPSPPSIAPTRSSATSLHPTPLHSPRPEASDANTIFIDPSRMDPDDQDSRATIHISPARNESCAQLAHLSSTNQTLSPFTRPLEHFTARSMPRLARSASLGLNVDLRQAERQPDVPVKARRRRLHRIGKAKENHESQFQSAEAVMSSAASASSMFPPPNGLESRSSSAGYNTPRDFDQYFPERDGSFFSRQSVQHQHSQKQK